MSASKRRQRTRAMRPDAFDPWEHNRIVARRRAYRRQARDVTSTVRYLMAMNRAAISTVRYLSALNPALTSAAAALRHLAGLPGFEPVTIPTTGEDLRRIYFGEDDE